MRRGERGRHEEITAHVVQEPQSNVTRGVNVYRQDNEEDEEKKNQMIK